MQRSLGTFSLSPRVSQPHGGSRFAQLSSMSTPPLSLSRSTVISFLIWHKKGKVIRQSLHQQSKHLIRITLTLPKLLGEMSRAIARCCAARTSSPIIRNSFASWNTTLDSSGAMSRNRTKSFSASCRDA